MNELIQELLEELQAKITAFTSSTVRKVQFSAAPNKIKVAIGMRRVGKTYLLLQTIQNLLKKNIPFNRILYLNFEDDRLFPASQETLRNLIDGFYSLHPENHHHLCYLFLDEIQNVESWPRVIRRYFDTKQTEIYLTGSSAKLLSKEIATSLRGRSIATEVWPFSFNEYLLAKNFPLKTEVLGKITRDHLQQQLTNYLQEGGFPETTHQQSFDRPRILQDYVDVVIFRDIIERHKITNITLIKYMIKTLLKNTGSLFSANKFFNDLKSQGFVISKTTVHDYLGYLEDAYMIFTVPLYAESVRKTKTNPRKIYGIDTGLVNAYTTSFSHNWGHLFENLIYLDMKRQSREVYYYLTKERYEVDFLTKDLSGDWHLYQVVWDTSDNETLQRETRALHAAEKELGIKGTLITPASYVQDFCQQLSGASR